ncbi:MAG: hypothetical protein WB996_12335 [Ignavibacteriaceae bacterium]
MSKDRKYRLIGVVLIITAILILLLFPDISKIATIATGMVLGIGLGLLFKGGNAFSFWK